MTFDPEMRNGSNNSSAENKETLADYFHALFGQHPQTPTYRFLADGEGEPACLTNEELDCRARAIAVILRERVPSGDRVLIICPPGLDYVAAFYGCLYAGVIAVPVYPPNPALLKRTMPRLLGIIEDARPSAVLAPASVVALARDLIQFAPALSALAWIAVDEVDLTAAASWIRPGIRGSDPAFLQYTSGSTGQPKGVVVGHGNLLNNLAAIHQLFLGDETDVHSVTWLPPYHDMGLIGGLLEPAYSGSLVTFMSPLAFLKRPARWLAAISAGRATHSGAPNFAYELCAEKIPAAEREGLDLSSWRVAFTGAEPVRAATMERFSQAFESSGFDRSAFFPCYGLAEGTLFVSGGQRQAGPVTRRVDAKGLEVNEVVDAGADGGQTVVGCGNSIPGHQIIIADPESMTRVPGGRVGEVWVTGPSVAGGYWGRAEESAAVFAARLADTGEGPFLRTGDLGFLSGAELFVTGRLKDLIIVAGRNHYPQDIEQSVETCHPALRPGGAVACALPSGDDERLLIVHEVNGDLAKLDGDRVIWAIRAKVAQEHDLKVSDVALVRRGSIPKTSSGKVRRSACRDAFVSGALGPAVTWSLAVPASAEVPGAVNPSAAPAADAEDKAARKTPRWAPGPAVIRLAELEGWLLAEVARRADVPPGAIDVGQPLAAYGLPSADMVGLVGDLERQVGHDLPATLPWEYPSIEALARAAYALAGGEDGESSAGGPLPRASTEHPVPAGHLAITAADRQPAGAQPVAIVGIGCRFPGGADSPGDFWNLLTDGRDAVTEVPAARWNAADFFDRDPAVPGKATTRWGGFIEGADLFDPHFFGISPREAARMDPQQRLLAEVAWEALEDAGITADRLAGTPTGVFVGISTSDYGHAQFQDLDRIDAYTGTGNAHSIAANRLSYLFDLRGPSLAIDTACSSSLVAIQQACTTLAAGECTVALAGGVNLIFSPALSVNFSKAGAMAADGRCKPFDARADGYVRAEGAGIVVLKPLPQAIADQDSIYAVILGGAVNQDGRTNGLMAPSPGAQEAVLRAAYDSAGVRPADVDYIEAHGTGTLLGDPLEAKALSAVVAEGRDSGRPCLIGSVKSNVGHLEAAAGVAGLVKAALMVRHRQVPASLHYEAPNPHISFPDLSLEVASSPREWPSAGTPALAGISSFGFGGTNAHLVLRGPPPEPAGNGARPGPQVLAISARSEEALRQLAGRYHDVLGAGVDDIGALCAAAAVRRTHHDVRLACAGDSAPELQAALDALGRGEPHDGLSWGTRRVGRRPQTVFVFAGQGARWWPLAADLAAAEPAFRAVIERCDATLRRLAGWSLLGQLAAGPNGSLMSDPAVGQPALCAVQIAVAALWRSWGVEPAAVVGHSVGEIAAAQVAGALTLDDALRVALCRGRAIQPLIGQGQMAVAAISAARAAEVLARDGAGAVWVAAVNSPQSTVLSGEPRALRRMAEAMTAEGIFCRVLESVDFASHSPQVDAVQAGLVADLAGLTPRPATIGIFSTVRGAAVDGTELTAAYWAENLRQPVLFEPVITALAGQGHDVFVEISPHPMLTDSIGDCLASVDAAGTAVASLRRDMPGRTAMLRQLGQLYTTGYPVDWRKIYGARPQMVTLPHYPWQRQRYWLDDEYPRGRAARRGGHPVLETALRSAAEPAAYHWSGRVDLAGFPWLGDHQVDETVVLPASLLLDAAAAAVTQVPGNGTAVTEDIQFTAVTVVPGSAEQDTLQVIVFPETVGTGSFQIFSRDGAPAGDDWTEAAHGRFRIPAGSRATPPGALTDARASCRQPVDRAALYAGLRTAGLQYGPAFQGIESAWRGEHEAVAQLRDPAELTSSAGQYLIHPALLDSCLQTIAAALPLDGAASAMYLPVSVGRLTLNAGSGPVAPHWAHAVISAAPQPDGDIDGAQVELFDKAGNLVGALEGITLRRVGHPVADPVARSLLQVGWNEQGGANEEVAGPGGPATGNGASAGRWLLFADQGRVCDNLRTLLLSRGGDCLTVTPGLRYRQVGASRYEIDPRNPRDMAALLAAAGSARPGPLAGIVYAWCLDAVVGESGPEPVEAACLPVLHLVQALSGGSGTREPRVALVTRGAQRVAGEAGLPGLAQSPLWGLARVMMLEHPELHPVIIDLDAAPGSDQATGLLNEILPAAGAGQVVLRGGRRYRPALEPADLAAAEQAPGNRRPFNPGQDRNLRLLALQPGILDSLEPTLWERIPPSSGEVQIEVTAAGLNFSDVLKALGNCPGVPPGTVPLGAECAGRVTAVGTGVTEFRRGDAVMAVAPSALAAFATTRSYLVAAMPPGLTDEQAAAVPVAFLTAVYGLEYLARLRPGEKVLIHSATGGVGLAALQVARRNGAEVFATAGTDAKRDLLRELGVRHVMDSRSLRFADEIRALTGGAGVDVVLNALAGEALTRSLGLLAPGGRFVEIGKQDVYANSHLGMGALRHNRTFFAVDLERSFAADPVLIRELFDLVTRGFETGDFTALPVRSYPYGAADAAFAEMAQARHTGKIVLRPDGTEQVADAPPRPAVSGERTYLITGGLGALGLETARYLVGQGARHLMLVGRRGPSAAASAQVAELAAQAEVTVRAADVSKFGDVAGVIAEIGASMPPLGGIVHAAGVLDDGFLVQLDEDRFRAVAAPKASAAWHLHIATRDIPLDFFVLYSSAAALLGSPGQGNYAAANAFLDALAGYRHSLGLPALSIGWGPWSQIGLAASPSRAGALGAYGIASLRPADGTAALGRLLFTALAHAIVLPLDRAALRDAADRGLAPSLLAGLIAPSVAPGGTRRPESTQVRRKLLAVEPGRRRTAILLEHCVSEAARVLKTDPARIDATAPLASIGFDSLMALELSKRLEASLGVELSATVAWRFPTVDKLVPFLAERMQIPLAPGGAAQGTPAPVAGHGAPGTGTLPGDAAAADEAAPDAALAQLSGSDLEALLIATMTRIDEGY